MEVAGYIMRIATRQWINQVFNLAIYYTGVPRKFKPDQTILFVSKTDVGDAFIGYGIIKDVTAKDELSIEEKQECEKYGWRRAIEFSYIMQFEKPIRLKDTFLKESKLTGKYLHSLAVTKEQISSVIPQIEAPPAESAMEKNPPSG